MPVFKTENALFLTKKSTAMRTETSTWRSDNSELAMWRLAYLTTAPYLTTAMPYLTTEPYLTTAMPYLH